MEGSADPLTDVVRARERTLAAGSARIQLVSELIFRSSPWDQTASAFSRLTWRTAKAVGRMLMRTVFRKLDFRRMTAEGVIDMPGRRYRLAQGHYAWLYAEGKLWPGWSRRAIATLEPWEEDEPRRPEPLWLLDLLAGVTDTTEIGTEVVRRTPCRHLRVVVDASRVAGDSRWSPCSGSTKLRRAARPTDGGLDRRLPSTAGALPPGPPRHRNHGPVGVRPDDR